MEKGKREVRGNVPESEGYTSTQRRRRDLSEQFLFQDVDPLEGAAAARLTLAWCDHLPQWPAECSAVLFREHVCIQVGYPLLPFLGNSQIPECIADIGADHLPEESWIPGS